VNQEEKSMWQFWNAAWPVKSTCGRRMFGPMMRRRTGGPWWWPRYDYRAMTPDEIDEFVTLTAW
jgi:hypothetical protein